MQKTIARLIAIALIVYSLSFFPKLLLVLFWLCIAFIWTWYHERKLNHA